MPVFSLALASLLNRRVTALLTVLAISISVWLLLGVEKVRTGAKSGFANTISGTDLIVGARTGSTQLLLYSVFHIGNATNNISWRSYREIASGPDVAWTIPLSLGDSHRGFRVLGTNEDYFRHFRFGSDRTLTLKAGKPFADLFDAVVGADVAEALGYAVGDGIVIAHGLGKEGFQTHEDRPFRIAGILAKTGTPVDRTVHVSLEGIEAIHVDWRNGARVPGLSPSVEEIRKKRLRPKSITAFLVGLESRFAIFDMQRSINEYRREPLTAIPPGIALQELWDLMGPAETSLSVVSGFVVVSGLLGMMLMLLASLGERRRELAILRSVGAGPAHILALVISEATILTASGAAAGIGLLYVSLVIAQPLLEAEFGIFLEITGPSPREWLLMGVVVGAGALAGAVPAIQACRQSLAEGMVVRL
jgi:putative ABC transport system permease protein